MTFDPTTLVKGRRPSLVEILTTDELGAVNPAAAKIKMPSPAEPIEVPPFSLTRIVWEKEATGSTSKP